MSEYFSHDYSARNDVKLKKLLMKHGVAGIGVYWCVIEMLYESEGRLPDEAAAVISFDLRADETLVNSVIDDFELFVRKDGFFSSPSVLRRLNERAEKSEMAKKSADARWSKCERNTNAMRTQYERNANSNAPLDLTQCADKCERNTNAMLKIKENKRKEKESKNIYCAFFDSVWGAYPNKKGKDAVSKKALMELQDAGEDAVMGALRRYVSTKPDWQQWMYGSTFFNGRWRDYLEDAVGDAAQCGPRRGENWWIDEKGEFHYDVPFEWGNMTPAQKFEYRQQLREEAGLPREAW